MDIFTALKRVFSTGLIVSDVKNNSIKIIDTQRTQAYTRRNTFFSKLHRNQYYQSTLAQNYSINRLALYRDYDMMDADPILSSALDIYTFQALTKDEYGDIIKIKSNDSQIEEILRELFYQRLNCQFNFSVWFRSFVKYGDFFLALRLDDELGIIGSEPISPYDIERVEDDERNPDTYYFKFVAGGNELIDNYNIGHFRLLKDPNFLPYGRSALQPARRIWKNLSLMIDAMMIQRIMRAPERRVFKVDVGDLDNEEVGPFMADVIQKMKKIPYKDPQTGQINLKYNIQNLLQDFFIPVRGKQDGSSIETLAGMQNNMIQDIEFIKSYMLAALKIPKAFLSFEQGIQAKCFSPYTKIKLLDGRVLNLLQLSKIYDQNPNIKLETLCYDFQLNKFVPTIIKWCSKTRLNAQMVRVHLDNKTYVDVTPDHKFILKDLSLKMAKDLTPGDSLLRYDVIYDKNNYQLIYQNDTNKYEYIHKIVDQSINGKIINNGYDQNGKFIRNDIIVVHHKDFNKNNNSTSNLVRMSFKEHGILHSKMACNFKRPEAIKKRIIILKSKEVRNKISNSLKVSKKAINARKKLIKRNRLPENRKYNSEITKKYMSNNESLKFRLANFWKSLSFQQRSNVVKKGWNNSAKNRYQIARNIGNNNLNKTINGYRPCYYAIKNKYQNDDYYYWAKGINSTVWIERPSIEYLENCAKNIKYNPKFQQFVKQVGFKTSRIVKQVILQKYDSTQQFLNKYFGFKNGRKKDIPKETFINLIQHSQSLKELQNNKMYPLGEKAINRLLKQFNLTQQFIEQHLGIKYNHKVAYIQYLNQKMDTYNLQVEHKDHNILLYDNGIVIKQSTLASLDIIFARLIEDLQNLFLSQLYRIALIHLFILGYTDINNINFTLQLNNPSNVKKIQDIELWNQKIDLGTKMEQSKHFSLQFIYKNIYDINPDQSKQILKQVVKDTQFKTQLAMIEQGGGQESGFETESTNQEEAPGQLEQEVKEQVNPEIQYQPLTNNFQGNTPLNLDK